MRSSVSFVIWFILAASSSFGQRERWEMSKNAHDWRVESCMSTTFGTLILPANISNPPYPPREDFRPALPAPWKFQTRPTLPVKLKIYPNPALPVRVPYPSGRVGSGCRTLVSRPCSMILSLIKNFFFAWSCSILSRIVWSLSRDQRIISFCFLPISIEKVHEIINQWWLLLCLDCLADHVFPSMVIEFILYFLRQMAFE